MRAALSFFFFFSLNYLPTTLMFAKKALLFSLLLLSGLGWAVIPPHYFDGGSLVDLPAIFFFVVLQPAQDCILKVIC